MAKGRFIFVPYTVNSKIDCPYCKGKKTFTLFVDTDTAEIMPDEYGRCDRINTCGYFKAPFIVRDNKLLTIEPEPPQKWVDESILKKTMVAYKDNAFVKSLVDIFGEKDAYKACTDFYIGTSKTNGTIFWNVDKNGFIWTAKVIHYYINESGEPKRDKNKIPYYHFKKSDGYKQFLFGVHLMDMEKDTFLVESEKTAVIGRITNPEYNWIGTGSAQGFTLLKAQYFKKIRYKGTFYCCGDCDAAGRTAANKWMDNLDSFGLKNKNHELGEQYTNGEDFADIIFERMRSRQRQTQ